MKASSSFDDEEYDYLDDQLDLDLLDKIYKYCMPTLATFAFFLRIICIIVFIRIKSSKQTLNNYLLVNSVAESIVSFSYGPFSIINRLKSTYLSKLMHIIFVIYFSNVAGMISSIMNLMASIDRLILIKNITTFKDLDFKLKLILTMFLSFLIHIPFIMEVEINQIEHMYLNELNESITNHSVNYLKNNQKQQIIYTIGHSNFSNQFLSRVLIHSVSFIRYILINIIMFLLNLLLGVEAFKLVAKKRKLLKINNQSCQLLLKKYTNIDENNSKILVSKNLKNNLESNTYHNLKNSDLSSSHNNLSVTPITPINHNERRKFSVQLYTETFKTLFTGKMNKTEWNLTLMTLVICFFYLIELNFICFSYYYLLFNKLSSLKKITIEIVTSNIIQVVNLIEILTYFIFNSLFRNELGNLFKLGFCYY